MMEKSNRINWRKGMDISPEVFIAADNYHIYHQNMIAGMQALKSYGILYERPENTYNFHIVPVIENSKLIIKDFYCHGVTQQGFMVEINRDAQCNNELNLRDCDRTPYYVLISVHPYKPKQVSDDDSNDYAQSSYIFKLQKTNIRTHNDDGIPILKIIYNGMKWEIVDNYIPPCVALSSLQPLEDKYEEIRTKLLRITQLIENNPYSFQIAILELELKNYAGFETPNDLFLLLKKFIMAFSLCAEKGLRDAKKFLETVYNHNEITEMFKVGIHCLDDYIAILTAAPPAPPPPAPEMDIFEIKI